MYTVTVVCSCSPPHRIGTGCTQLDSKYDRAFVFISLCICTLLSINSLQDTIKIQSAEGDFKSNHCVSIKQILKRNQCIYQIECLLNIYQLINNSFVYKNAFS